MPAFRELKASITFSVIDEALSMAWDTEDDDGEFVVGGCVGVRMREGEGEGEGGWEISV